MYKKILVYGYGLSGKAAVQLLVKNTKHIAVYDDGGIKETLPTGVQDWSGRNMGYIADNISLMVVSPSIRLDSSLCLAVKEKGVPVISELELAYRNFDGSIITVTGTNGKTTTVSLITEILGQVGIDARAVGNIGKPFSGEILDMSPASVAVVEASSFQLAGVDLYTSKIAICLNISSDHLEYHYSMKNYIACKSNVFKNQDTNDYAILNFDDIECKNMAQGLSSNVYYFSTSSKVKGAYLDGNNIYFSDGESAEYVCAREDICLKGAHNVANCLVAIAVAKILNIPNSAIKSVLSRFALPDYRVQYIGTYAGRKYYNDSKSTNISSTMCACESMVGDTVLLMGGYDKGLDYTHFFESLPPHIHTLVVYGANKAKLLEESRGVGSLSVICADSIEDGIDIASKVRCENVLFSPGTSSYDSFNDYRARGKYFSQYVMEKFGC